MKLLTSLELCDTLRISRSTLHRLRRRGLPGVGAGRLIRFDQDKVLGWYDLHQNTPATTMLFVGVHGCVECHYSAVISEPTDITCLQECPRCSSREK